MNSEERLNLYMNRESQKRNKGGKWEISFSPITRYSIVFCVIVLIIIFFGGAILSINQMKSKAELSLTGSDALISERVNGTIEFLESLTDLPEFYDPEVPPIDKVKKLDQMSPHFGYMMICYVDADYVADAKLKGIDPDTVMGHHGVGIFWNVTEWTMEE